MYSIKFQRWSICWGPFSRISAIIRARRNTCKITFAWRPTPAMPLRFRSNSMRCRSSPRRINKRKAESRGWGILLRSIFHPFLLADTMTLRDLYKKSHWQVAGPTFYQLHLLFDKHFDEQVELVDAIAERIQLLGGVSLAMAADVAETTQIERPPRGREEVPVQLSRLLDAHKIIIRQCRELAERADRLGDDGTNDLAVSDVLRTNELQVWFLSEHLVNMPLVEARG